MLQSSDNIDDFWQMMVHGWPGGRNWGKSESGFWEILAAGHCHVANSLANSEKRVQILLIAIANYEKKLAQFQENAILRNDVKFLETNPTSKR